MEEDAGEVTEAAKMFCDRYGAENQIDFGEFFVSAKDLITIAEEKFEEQLRRDYEVEAEEEADVGA